MKKIILFIAIFVVVGGDAQNQNTPTFCVNPNGKIGNCQSLDECDTIVEIFNKPNLTERDTEFLKASVCSANPRQYAVCCTDDKEFRPELGTRFSATESTSTSSTARGCPIVERGSTQTFSTGILECDTEQDARPAPVSQSPFIVTRRPVQVTNTAVPCLNPNKRRGECLPYNNCKPLLGLLNGPTLSEESQRFLRESVCPGNHGGIPNYCCTDDYGYIKQKTSIYFPPEHVPQYMPSHNVGKTIPRVPNCGAYPIVDKILNGNETGIGEFPWMALIEYRKNGERKLSCAGSLINQRYVLTAAHCVSSKFTRGVGEPTLIRLGDHNISSRIDCVVGDTNDCNLDIVEIGIEKIISHENYNENSRNNENDIALIRLNQNIPSRNAFIEPVCLPHAVGYYPSQPGTILTVAGWGTTEEGRQSNIKLKLEVPVTTETDCARTYATKSVQITSSQLCAGGILAQDSCSGDSGGPLMALLNTSWVLEGIVSFGYSCGVEGWPGIYTRVHNYEHWILQNLEL